MEMDIIILSLYVLGFSFMVLMGTILSSIWCIDDNSVSSYKFIRNLCCFIFIFIFTILFIFYN